MIRRPPRSTPLSLHDALPISRGALAGQRTKPPAVLPESLSPPSSTPTTPYQRQQAGEDSMSRRSPRDRKSTRLNSSHANISYAVFCLKKKKYRVIYLKKNNDK